MVFNSLPLGPAVTGCMENSLVYQITFGPARGSASSMEADGWVCDRQVTVVGHGTKMSPLYDANCSLLKVVVAVRPPHQDQGTRAFMAHCKS